VGVALVLVLVGGAALLVVVVVAGEAVVVSEGMLILPPPASVPVIASVKPAITMTPTTAAVMTIFLFMTGHKLHLKSEDKRMAEHCELT
jgi:hypothetical protein